MIIDFEGKCTFNQQIDIVDPGNCCIKCSNDDWVSYYLIIKTIRGISHIFEFGPIAPDIVDLLPDFYVRYSRIKFNEKKIFGKLSGFLNDPKKEISSVEEDFVEDALDELPDMAELFLNLQ